MAKLRFGEVVKQDLDGVRVQVEFKERDGVVSPWLMVPQRGTKDNKFYDVPDLGSHVACLLDEHDEEGLVLGAVYSDVDEAPVKSGDKWHVTFKDGTKLEYDRASHELTVDAPDGKVLIKCPAVMLGASDLAAENAVVRRSDLQAVIEELNALKSWAAAHKHIGNMGAPTPIDPTDAAAPAVAQPCPDATASDVAKAK